MIRQQVINDSATEQAATPHTTCHVSKIRSVTSEIRPVSKRKKEETTVVKYKSLAIMMPCGLRNT